MLPKGRRPRAEKDSRKVLTLFPRGSHNKKVYWLYAIGFVGGITKIGRSSHPRSRLGQHWSKANGAVEWLHLFGRGSSHWSCIAEDRACDLAAQKAERVLKTEWFRGLTRADAIGAGRAASLSAMKTVIETEARQAVYQLEQKLYAKARAEAAEQIKALRAKVA